MTTQRHLTMVGASGEALDAKGAAAEGGGGTVASDQVRERLREEMVAKGVSLEKAAKAIGYAPSTLSLWLSGNYGANDAHVAGKVLSYIKREKVRALALKEGEPVKTAVWETTRGAIADAHEHSMLALVVGEPGCGKTTAAVAYARERERNAWFVRASDAASGSQGMTRQLYRVVTKNEATIVRHAERIAAHLEDKLRGTRGVIIVDEAQELKRGGLEVLRRLYDEARVGVVLIGNPRIKQRLMDGGDLYAQIRDRIDIVRYVDGLLSASDYERVLGNFGVVIEPEAMDCLVKAGSVRRAVQLLKIAGRGKVGQGISLEHVKAAAAVAMIEEGRNHE